MTCAETTSNLKQSSLDGQANMVVQCSLYNLIQLIIEELLCFPQNPNKLNRQKAQNTKRKLSESGVLQCSDIQVKQFIPWAGWVLGALWIISLIPLLKLWIPATEMPLFLANSMYNDVPNDDCITKARPRS